MKKVLFTIFGFGLLSLNAQVINDRINSDYPQFKIAVKNDGKNNNAKRDLGAGWFDYATAYNDFNGTGLVSSIMFLQPDTNLSIVYSSGDKQGHFMHVFGRVNDPRDEVFQNNPARFSRHNTYTWDSIRFTQFYIRFADSMKVGNANVAIVDTVFIQYFMPSGLNNSFYSYNADPSKRYYYSAPNRDNYKKATRLNSSAFKTDTLFLTKAFADSVSLDGANTLFFARSYVAPVGVTIPHSSTNINASIIGHSFTFKPMKTPKLGDTGVAMDGSTWVNKFNMYGMRYFSKAGVKIEAVDPESQNNTFVTNSSLVYGQTVNGWRSYFPGSIFTNTLVESTDYHLTTQTLSVNTLDANGNGIGNIYPNPSNSSNEIFVPVKLAESKIVTLTICDVTGKVVKTIRAEYGAGDFDITVSTEGMDSGVYTCTMVAGDFKATTKFVLN